MTPPGVRMALLAVFMAATLGAEPAAAQMFGANKVQYRTFHFEVMRTEHFDIYYYPAERHGVDVAARLAERWYSRLSQTLDHQLSGRQPIILYASHSDFQQTNVIDSHIGEGTGGVTEPVRRRIVLPFSGPLAETDHVLGHELVHAFQFDMTRQPGRTPGSGLSGLPLWFVEGMAEYLSLGGTDMPTAMWLRDTARQDALPALKDLDKSKYFPYRWGHAFWAYVGGRWGDDVIRSMLLRASAADVTFALDSVLGLSEDQFSHDWRAAIRIQYAPFLAATAPPVHAGVRILGGEGFGAEVNVGPALSPDGRWLAFLSERSYFSMDLFVADAATGRIVHRLTATSSSPHYSSLQSLYSSGGWDSTSRRLAIGTVTGGRAALAVFDATNGRREREIVVPGVDEIFNPTWAPDGSEIAFTGMTGGFTDLFTYDLSSHRVRRLTEDIYADLHPAWSPDGRYVAFATDRFTTDLGTLAAGPYRLALLDLASTRVEEVTCPGAGQMINPQWSPDGTALYYVGQSGGVANVFRLTLASRSVAQVTAISTGVTGVTASSPALSVAGRPARAAYSVFERGRYIVMITPLEQVTVTPFADLHLDTLPPIERRPSAVGDLLSEPRKGLPPPTPQPTAAYRPRLALEGTTVGSIGVGVGRLGTTAGGAVGLAFSDMLNSRSLFTAFQVNSSLTGGVGVRDIAAQAAYINREHRWNWGLVGGQVPYLAGAIDGWTSADGLVAVDRVSLYRQTERAVSGLAVYPLDRARRVELQAGMARIGFDRIERTDSYSTADGRWLFTTTSVEKAATPLTLATAAAAFVSDRSHMGATSPVQGERFRLEASPAIGSLQVATVTADYRRYLMPVPFYTLATRVLHHGRYGSGSDDGRLLPLSLGYPSLVRGYDANTFDVTACALAEGEGCRVFDNLLGSRLLVGNIEFRMPLLRPFGVSQRMYGPVPTELAVFADGGVAWSAGQHPELFGGSRRGVASAGMGLRTNVFGVAVIELAVVRPFQRLDRGWVVQFSMVPGF